MHAGVVSAKTAHSTNLVLRLYHTLGRDIYMTSHQEEFCNRQVRADGILNHCFVKATVSQISMVDTQSVPGEF